MMADDQMRIRFVDEAPDELEERTLYISMECANVLHKCVCGCGREVSTPLLPQGGWGLTFDGKTVSLNPSVGNWKFPCKSHYWIRRSRIIWAEPWSDNKIETAWKQSENRRAANFDGKATVPTKPERHVGPLANDSKESFWQRLMTKLFG
jgi:Family of unknown function (DUF6527)